MATCIICGNAFDAERSTKKYCSAACRQQAYLGRLSVKIDSNDNSELAADIVNSVNVFTVKSTDVAVRDAKYHWIVPDWFRQLEEQMNQQENRERLDALLVGADRLNVKMVTSAWQSILQRILRFSYQPYIKTRELKLIVDAIQTMIESFEFGNLTSRYPYKQRIQELGQKWYEALQSQGGHAVFELDEKIKLEFFQILCEIGSVTDNRNIPFIYQTHK